MILKKKTRSEPEIPSSSMSDVAFLLLIFFLVTTIFNLERGLDLTLPNSQSSPKRINPKNICEIKIAATGKITIDDKEVGLPEIETIVRKRALENEKLMCVIETDPKAYYGFMVDVLDELKTAEARKITLRTGKG